MKPVVITRPWAQAQQWVQQLQAHGCVAHALPLLDIVAAPDAAALQQHQQQAPSYDALMFVSPQAVTHFAHPTWLTAANRCWAPGPGTAQVLQQAGVAAHRIDQPRADAAQFDAQALWAVVQQQVHVGHRLLWVRGYSASSTVRDDLAQQCVARGGKVESCWAYQRTAARWDAAMHEQAHTCLANSAVWLLSSSQALAQLPVLLPQADWAVCSAVATHPRIAQAAQSLGFGKIVTTRPTFAEVWAGLQTCF